MLNDGERGGDHGRPAHQGKFGRRTEHGHRQDARGNVVWTAELPDPEAVGAYDTYTAVRREDGQLAANSWLGHDVRIDPATGQILSREFVK